MGANPYKRIDTLELKARLHQKLGQQRFDKYFILLNKYFSRHINKLEFEKFCTRIIGRENRPLHNQLISSLYKNATLSKTPPPTTTKKFTNSLNIKVAKGQRNNSLQSFVPLSPRKSRSPRDRKSNSRFSPLGQNGKSDLHQSPTELHSLGSRPPVEVLSVEDGEEVVSGSPGIQSRSPVTAPLGISLTRKSLYRPSAYGPANVSRAHMCQNSFELPDSRYLRGCLRQKVEVEGVSVSEDCANLVNVGLDAYLKRLIEPCIGLARSRLGQSQSQSQTATTYMQRQRPKIVSSVLDFSVAMECDPRILGVDWSTQIEKIRCSTFEE